MIPGQAPILFLFEWLGIKARSYEGLERLETLRISPSFLSHMSSRMQCQARQLVALHSSYNGIVTCVEKVALFELFIIRSYRPKFRSQSGATILRGKCGCLRVNPLLNLSTYVLVSRWIFQSKIFIFSTSSKVEPVGSKIKIRESAVCEWRWKSFCEEGVMEAILRSKKKPRVTVPRAYSLAHMVAEDGAPVVSTRSCHVRPTWPPERVDCSFQRFHLWPPTRNNIGLASQTRHNGK